MVSDWNRTNLYFRFRPCLTGIPITPWIRPFRYPVSDSLRPTPRPNFTHDYRNQLATNMQRKNTQIKIVKKQYPNFMQLNTPNNQILVTAPKFCGDPSCQTQFNLTKKSYRLTKLTSLDHRLTRCNMPRVVFK